MIQCVICATTYTKDGYPNKFFNYNDKHIYGCPQCKAGDWVKHNRITLVGYKISIVKDKVGNEKDDRGYLDYDRDENCEIEGIKWADLDVAPRGLRHGKGELEVAENIGSNTP